MGAAESQFLGSGICRALFREESVVREDPPNIAVKDHYYSITMENISRLGVVKFYRILTAVLLLTLSTASQARLLSSDASDVYEKLETYGFPEGLLPHTVTNYNLEPNGRFTLYLESRCPVLIEDKYPLVYDKVITGMLSYGKLQGLKGISVKAYYVWWSITGIALGDDNSLFFEIGILSAKFPYNNFDDPPVCGMRSSAEAAFMDPIPLR